MFLATQNVAIPETSFLTGLLIVGVVATVIVVAICISVCCTITDTIDKANNR